MVTQRPLPVLSAFRNHLVEWNRSSPCRSPVQLHLLVHRTRPSVFLLQTLDCFLPAHTQMSTGLVEYDVKHNRRVDNDNNTNKTNLFGLEAHIHTPN